MLQSQFHPLEGLSSTENADANIREFKGDGTPYLKVVGLLSVTSVRVGRQEIPLKITQDYPDPKNPKAKITKVEDLISLQKAGDGTPILLRSLQSNHGLWQKDVPVYVSGEWVQKKAAPATQTNAGTQNGGTGSGGA